MIEADEDDFTDLVSLAIYLHNRDMDNLAIWFDDCPCHFIIDAVLDQIHLSVEDADVRFPYLSNGKLKHCDAVPIIDAQFQSAVIPRLVKPQFRVHQSSS